MIVINNLDYRVLMAQGVRYVVHKEHTLGVISPDIPGYVAVLHGSMLKGGPDWKNGPVLVGDNDTLRAATVADFTEYRVTPPKDFR